MGCCLSSSHQNDTNHCHPPPPPPPPPTHPVEEESVKEVLSETPFPRQKTNFPILQDKCTQTPSLEECETKVDKDFINKREEEDLQVQVFQFSGMCGSIKRDTVSMATTTTTTTVTTVTENREDERVSKRVNRSPNKAPRKRPHTGKLGGARERAAKSPARRGNPPASSGQVGSRPVRGRELYCPVRSNQRSVRSRSSEVSRDSSEGPCRRSRSPATQKPSGVGSPIRRTGRACGVRLVGAGLEVEGVGTRDEHGTVLPKQENECLDNPLVSFECFIFL